MAFDASSDGSKQAVGSWSGPSTLKCHTPAKIFPVNLLNWVLSFLGPFRKKISVIVLLVLTEVALAALAPWPLKVLVDSVLDNVPLHPIVANLLPETVLNHAAAFLIVVVTAGFVVQLAGELVRMAHTQMQVDMGQHVVYRLRETLLTHLQALPLRHHLATSTADSVYRLDADAYCVDDLVIGGIFPMTVAGLNISLMFGVLIYLDPTLALLSLSITPFLYMSLRHHARTMTVQAETVKTLESNLLSRALEVLSSIAAVKSFTRERHELGRFSTAGDLTMRARLDLTWQESLFSATVTAITLVGTALVLGVGGLHVLNGRLTVGSLLVVVAYLAAVYTPISEIARTTGALQQAIVSAKRVRSILALTPERPDAPGSINANAITGHLRFSNVLFSYDDERLVLDDVSFEARPGEVIALVGPTGAGKTTVANLIPRLFDVNGGQVLLDDINVVQYSLRSLRNQIALVPQHPILFTGTIADNIRYGRLDASHDEVEAAARSLQAVAGPAVLALGEDWIGGCWLGVAPGVGLALIQVLSRHRQAGPARRQGKTEFGLVLVEPTRAAHAVDRSEGCEVLVPEPVGDPVAVQVRPCETGKDLQVFA